MGKLRRWHVHSCTFPRPFGPVREHSWGRNVKRTVWSWLQQGECLSVAAKPDTGPREEATAPVRTMHGLYQVCLCACDGNNNFQYIFYAMTLYSVNCSRWRWVEFHTWTAVFNSVLTLNRRRCLCLLICVTKQQRGSCVDLRPSKSSTYRIHPIQERVERPMRTINNRASGFVLSVGTRWE